MAEARHLDGLIGVYQADGGVVGELRYALAKVTGRGHCALCDITHAGVRRKSAWDEVCAGIGVPFELVHLNERSAPVRAASEGATPCVLAEVDGQLEVVLGPGELDACAGDVERFARALAESLAAHALGVT